MSIPLNQKKDVTSKFFNRIKRNHRPPFLTEDSQHIVEAQSTSQNDDINNIYEDSAENCAETYDELIASTTKALQIFKNRKQLEMHYG